MAVAVFTSFAQQSDSSGDPLSGGTITVYAAGTTTPLALFSDAGLSTPATNPIVLNSAGRHQNGVVYIAPASYKVLLKAANGTTVAMFDDVDPGLPLGTGALAIANGGTGADNAPLALSNLGGATAAELADLAAEVASLSDAADSVERTHLATGSTAQRPSVPVVGDIRRNTTTSRWEGYYGSDWENFITSSDIASSPVTKQYLTSGTAATYTTPAGVKALVIKMIGGGGGGAGSSGAGGSGGQTSFGSVTASGGSGGLTNGSPQGGGSGGSGGSFRIAGASGNPASETSNGVALGGAGGSGFFGGAGNGGRGGSAGASAATNSGGGGGGAGASSGNGRGGGGSGEYAEAVIASPSASYTYTVGAGGTAGTGSPAGGAGGSGVIIVEEYY